MTYSYGGWQNEFDGLTLENEFSGSAPSKSNTNEKVQVGRPIKRPEPEVFRPTKRPTGLGAKVVVADDTSDDNETKNDESIYGVVKNIMNDTDPLAAPTATNMITERNTNLYIAQKGKRQKETLSYLDKLALMGAETTNPYGLDNEVVAQGLDPQVPETFSKLSYFESLIADEEAKGIFDKDINLLSELYQKRNNARFSERFKDKPERGTFGADFKYSTATGRKYDNTILDRYNSILTDRVETSPGFVDALLGTDSFMTYPTTDTWANDYGYLRSVDFPFGLDASTRVKVGDLPPLSNDLDPETGRYVGGKTKTDSAGYVVKTSLPVFLNDEGFVVWSEKEGIVADRAKKLVADIAVKYMGQHTIDFLFELGKLFNNTVQSKEDYKKLEDEMEPEINLQQLFLQMEVHRAFSTNTDRYGNEITITNPNRKLAVTGGLY
tara:strand:+ start:759 stop:2072 length:1314 start_codon:yes stop_codon:yes gene_type:complete